MKNTDAYLLRFSVKYQNNSVFLKPKHLKVIRQIKEYKSHISIHRAKVTADTFGTADNFLLFQKGILNVTGFPS